MKEFKNYKEYFVNKEIWSEKRSIEKLKELQKKTKQEFENMDNWNKRNYYEVLTQKQVKLLNENKIKELKKLLPKRIEKAKIKLQEKKKEAIEKYNKIKELKDVKKAIIEIQWSKGRGAYGYQTKGFCRVWYKNGDFNSYESSYTGGCGYDKPSTTLSQICNEFFQIMILKNDKKILKDEKKHYRFYACEPLYWQYGVGISSYESAFKNLGYKTQFLYHHNEDITIIIEK